MKLRPLQDRVLIRRVEPEAKTAGGIFIPDTAQEKPMEGEVIAVGPGVRDEDGKLHPSSIPSFYTTENIPLNDLHPDTVSAKRAMRGDSLCSGMVGINS